MRPYSLLQGDCRDVLPTLEAESVDVVITDPPYGSTSLAWDARVIGWLPLVARVLKPSGSVWCFGSLRSFLEDAAAFADWRFVQDLVWEKHNGSSFHADRFKRVHEHVAQFIPAHRSWSAVYKQPVYTLDARRRTVRRTRRPAHLGQIDAGHYTSEEGGPRLMRSVLYARSCNGYAVHPTQKPVDVLLPIIRYSCPPGGVVLDPFAGSGSTGVAAIEYGCRFIGVERCAEYVVAAARRLAETAAQGRLFDLSAVETS